MRAQAASGFVQPLKDSLSAFHVARSSEPRGKDGGADSRSPAAVPRAGPHARRSRCVPARGPRGAAPPPRSRGVCLHIRAPRERPRPAPLAAPRPAPVTSRAAGRSRSWRAPGDRGARGGSAGSAEIAAPGSCSPGSPCAVLVGAHTRRASGHTPAFAQDQSTGCAAAKERQRNSWFGFLPCSVRNNEQQPEELLIIVRGKRDWAYSPLLARKWFGLNCAFNGTTSLWLLWCVPEFSF